MISNRFSVAVVVGGLCIARGAVADDYYFAQDAGEGIDNPAARYSLAWSEPTLRSGIGIGVALGGGVGGFTDQTMRDTTTDVGGLWDLRVSIGTHIPLAVDISYIGTAANVRSLGESNGTLVGTGIESALRYNILPHNDFNPYVFAGVGYQRYDMRNTRIAQSDSGVLSEDAVAVFPIGTGISYRDRSGFTGDLRGTFRATTESDLVVDPQTGSKADLHSWEASAAVGYEF